MHPLQPIGQARHERIDADDHGKEQDVREHYNPAAAAMQARPMEDPHADPITCR
jgi:hypothetical protein